jgi:hypothetical protein
MYETISIATWVEQVGLVDFLYLIAKLEIFNREGYVVIRTPVH